MAKAIWTGSLSFGLVNIPVRLFGATTPRDVRFHQFQQGTGKRIRYRRMTEAAEEREVGQEAPSLPVPAAGARTTDDEAQPRATMAPSEPPEAAASIETEVAYGQIVKGFEIEPDRYVMVSPEELRALEPERTQTIEIEGFVDLAEIDPISFEKSYYVAPRRGVGAERPYLLLLEALRSANRAGIARFVMRTREYLAAIRAMDGIVVLETLFYADEIRPVSEIDNVPEPVPVPQRELAMALQFVELLSMAWDPTGYRDSYRDRVLELLRARAETEGVVRHEPSSLTEARPAVPDLMAALKASVEAAKDRQVDTGGGRPTRGRRRETG